VCRYWCVSGSLHSVDGRCICTQRNDVRAWMARVRVLPAPPPVHPRARLLHTPTPQLPVPLSLQFSLHPLITSICPFSIPRLPPPPSALSSNSMPLFPHLPPSHTPVFLALSFPFVSLFLTPPCPPTISVCSRKDVSTIHIRSKTHHQCHVSIRGIF